MTERKSKVSILICAVLSFGVFASIGYSNVLAPGGCAGLGTIACPGAVTDFGTDPGFFPTTVLANTGVQNFTGISGNFAGTFDEIVARDSVTGNLDFIFQVHNNGTSLDAIDRITTNSFKGFTTDVGYSSTVFITAMGTGSRFPTNVDRNLGGDVVGFDFSDTTLGGLQPGQTTYLLVIKTNATLFTAGFVNFLDGDIAQVAAFAPTAVPEPTSVLLLGTVLFGVTSLMRRRIKKA